MTDPIKPALVLPEPEVHDAAGYRRAYTADQMRAYAAQAVAAERERCAGLAEATLFTGNTFPVTQLEQLRHDISTAIREPGKALGGKEGAR